MCLCSNVEGVVMERLRIESKALGRQRGAGPISVGPSSSS